jgi:hypothetical protein
VEGASEFVVVLAPFLSPRGLLQSVRIRPVGCRRSAWLCVNRGNYIKICMRRYYAPWLLWTPIRIFVILLWATLLGISGYGVTRIPMGLEQQLAVPVGSYVSGGFMRA